jgi:hypothetical protein
MIAQNIEIRTGFFIVLGKKIRQLPGGLVMAQQSKKSRPPLQARRPWMVLDSRAPITADRTLLAT